jgi:tripartite-type tricarboxylate transporter receptor subunit TctC
LLIIPKKEGFNMKKRNFKKIIIHALSALILLSPITTIIGSPAFGAGYPTRAIKLVVGASPGGGYDLQARLFAKSWPNYLPGKATIVVKHVVGGGGIVAANRVWVARPDGYTIMQMKMGAFVLDQIIHPAQIKYDIAKWEYIGQYTADTNALAVRVEIINKIRSYNDLVKFAEKKSIAFSAGGVGSSSHNKALVFSEASGIAMRFVHYTGTPETMASLMRSETDFNIFSAPSVARQDKNEIRALFVFSEKRSELLPESPSALEFGVPKEVLKRVKSNLVFSSPRALALPPKTSAGAVNILRNSFWEMVNSKEFIKVFKEARLQLDPVKGEDFVAQLPEMIDKVKRFAPLLKKHMK